MSKAKTPKANSNRSENTLKPVALIAGPTASGKSGLAMRLAEAREKKNLGTTIINADSMQVYRDIPIISAAPSEKEKAVFPHKLYGAWDAAQACSAPDWAELAKIEIAQAHDEGNLPVLVGGTGMYIRVLLDGIAPIPEIDPLIREQARALPTDKAYECLKIEDPERASQLEPGDSQRISRALEVVRSTGTTLSEWQRGRLGGIAGEIDLHPAIVVPDREWLYERCDRRFVEMLKNGAIEEVESLLKRSLRPELPAMRAIGVPEVAAFLRKEISREDMIERGQQATRNYAKRQYTWFRRQIAKDWPRLESENIDLKDIFAPLLQ